MPFRTLEDPEKNKNKFRQLSPSSSGQQSYQESKKDDGVQWWNPIDVGKAALDTVGRVATNTAKAAVPALQKTGMGVLQTATAIPAGINLGLKTAFGEAVTDEERLAPAKNLFYGLGKVGSGAVSTVASPLAGVVQELPAPLRAPIEVIGKAVEGTKNLATDITGTTGTEDGEAIKDAIDLATFLIPTKQIGGAMAKAKNKLLNSVTSPKPLMGAKTVGKSVSPAIIQKDAATRSFNSNLAKSGFFDGDALKFVDKTKDIVTKAPEMVAKYVDDYSITKSGSLLDDAVEHVANTRATVYKEIGKATSNNGAVVSNTVSLLDDIDDVARAQIGKSPTVQTILNIKDKITNGGTIGDLVSSFDEVRSAFSKPLDKFTSVNAQFMGKLQTALTRDIDDSLRSLGGEFASMADDLDSLSGTVKGYLDDALNTSASTLDNVPKSAQTLSMLDDTVRKNLQKNLFAGMKENPLDLIGTLDDARTFNLLDDVQKAEVLKVKSMQPVLNFGEAVGEGFGVMKKKFTPTNKISKQDEILDVVGKITQEKDAVQLKKLADGLDSIDLDGIKNYDDLLQKANETSKALQTVKKNKLQNMPTTKKLEDLNTTVEKTINGKVYSESTNFAKNALEQLDDFFGKTNDLNGKIETKSFLEKAKSSGLTANELDDLAILYNRNVAKMKAWTTTGKPKKGLTAEGVENTRKGLKTLSREMMPDDATKILDEKISNIIKVQDSAKHMVETVQNLKNQVEKRKFLGPAGRAIGQALDAVSAGFVKELVTSFIKSDVGLKRLNSMALTENLSKNIKTLQKLSKEIDTLPKTPTFTQVKQVLVPFMQQGTKEILGAGKDVLDTLPAETFNLTPKVGEMVNSDLERQ